MRQVLTGYADEVRMIEIADREDQIAAIANPPHAFLRARLDRERVLLGLHVGHLFTKLNRQFVGINNAAVIAQRFDADRKSTRLNSSHSQISYAVFCLKKKKKT